MNDLPRQGVVLSGWPLTRPEQDNSFPAPVLAIAYLTTAGRRRRVDYYYALEPGGATAFERRMRRLGLLSELHNPHALICDTAFWVVRERGK